MEQGQDIADPSADVAMQAEREEDKALLHSALQRLTDKQRTVLFLSIGEGKSRDIAKELRLNKDTVREHYHAVVKN